MGATLKLDLYQETTDKFGFGAWYTDSEGNFIHLKYIDDFYTGGKYSPFFKRFNNICRGKSLVVPIEDMRKLHEDCCTVVNDPSMLNEIFHKESLNYPNLIEFWDEHKETELNEIREMKKKLDPIINEQILIDEKIRFVYHSC